MDLKIYSPLLLFTCLHVTESLHYYKTPASNNQFSNFEITTSIPSDGKGGTKPKQAALKFAFSRYNRRYITFNFKGKGNAQLEFFNSVRSNNFKVIIGGGVHFNKVYVVSTKGKLYTATVNGITSDHEYRSFWIRAKWRDTKKTYIVYVGLCSDPRQNVILKTGTIKERMFKPRLYHIRLSTSSGSSGQWQFASAGQKLGGCGDDIRCSDSKAPKCDQKDKDWNSDITGLIGTCIPSSGYFPSVVFGSGKCRKVCGTGNEVCGTGEACKNNKCLAPTTKSTTTTTTTTTSNTSTTNTSSTTFTYSPTFLTTLPSTTTSTSAPKAITSLTSTTNIFTIVGATTSTVPTTTSNPTTTITRYFPSAPTATPVTTPILPATNIATTSLYVTTTSLATEEATITTTPTTSYSSSSAKTTPSPSATTPTPSTISTLTMTTTIATSFPTSNRTSPTNVASTTDTPSTTSTTTSNKMTNLLSSTTNAPSTTTFRHPTTKTVKVSISTTTTPIIVSFTTITTPVTSASLSITELANFSLTTIYTLINISSFFTTKTITFPSNTPTNSSIFSIAKMRHYPSSLSKQSPSAASNPAITRLPMTLATKSTTLAIPPTPYRTTQTSLSVQISYASKTPSHTLPNPSTYVLTTTATDLTSSASSYMKYNITNTSMYTTDTSTNASIPSINTALTSPIRTTDSIASASSRTKYKTITGSVHTTTATANAKMGFVNAADTLQTSTMDSTTSALSHVQDESATASSPTTFTTTTAATASVTSTVTRSNPTIATTYHISTAFTSTPISMLFSTLAVSHSTSASESSYATIMSVTTTTASITESTPISTKFAPTTDQTTMASTATVITTTTARSFPTTAVLYIETETEGSSLYAFGSGWAIIAGTGGGLATVVAIILVLWNRVSCCRRYLCLKGRVTPAKSSKPNNNDGDHMSLRSLC